jgi:hypothetical protein
VIQISEVEEDHSPIKPFLDNSRLKADPHEEESGSPLRKRGYSDVDQINFSQLKLNMKASL